MSAAQSAAQGPVMWLPQQASTIAGQSDAVLIAWIVVSVLVTGAIVGVMLFFGVRYRRGSSPSSSGAATSTFRPTRRR